MEGHRGSRDGRVAILAGGGTLPAILAAAAQSKGRAPVVFAISGEADPTQFGRLQVEVVRWGELGRLFRLLDECDCREAALIGSIARRPDFRAILPDLGAMKLLPRILRILRGGDDSVLKGVAALLEERGVTLVSPLDIAPGLGLPEGLLTGHMARDTMENVEKALEAARLIGGLDIGQAAVAAGGRVVAMEDAGGTDGLLERVAALRADGKIGANGGVLVKCMKPNQDTRLDLPTIGPVTALAARRAGLDGVAGEAGRSLLAGRDETVEAFARAGLFLLGQTPRFQLG